jgi:hypothetical protein
MCLTQLLGPGRDLAEDTSAGSLGTHAVRRIDDPADDEQQRAQPPDDPENVAILTHYLGEHRAARTVICCQLLEPTWLIEVEAVAAAAPR